jgi:hypothetical protein
MADFSQILQSILPVAGTAAGSAIGGPAGGMIGGQLGKMGANAIGGSNNPQTMSQQAGQMGMGIGIMQMLQGMQSKKQGQNFIPSYEDPRQLAMLAEINQKRKSLETGADVASAINAANQAQAATQAGIVKSTGGDIGGTVQALLQSERNTAGARNQALAQGAQRQLQYTGLAKDLLDNIEARKLQLQMYRSQQKMAEWARSMSSGQQNFLTGLTQQMQPPTVSADTGSSASGDTGANVISGGKGAVSDLLNSLNTGATNIDDMSTGAGEGAMRGASEGIDDLVRWTDIGSMGE